MEQRNQPQVTTVIRRQRIAFDIRQHVGDMIDHFTLGVAGAWPSPGDAMLPDGIGGDGAFERCF